MRERLTELLAKIRNFLSGRPDGDDQDGEASKHDPSIEFRPLSPPQAAALGADTALVCPVTRQSLQTGSVLLYLCRDCNTSYSAEGWDFLKKMDKGRCCNCRHVGSVVPFHGGSSR